MTVYKHRAIGITCHLSLGRDKVARWGPIACRERVESAQWLVPWNATTTFRFGSDRSGTNRRFKSYGRQAGDLVPCSYEKGSLPRTRLAFSVLLGGL